MAEEDRPFPDSSSDGLREGKFKADGFTADGGRTRYRELFSVYRRAVAKWSGNELGRQTVDSRQAC